MGWVWRWFVLGFVKTCGRSKVDRRSRRETADDRDPTEKTPELPEILGTESFRCSAEVQSTET